jgi:hypothetical protein
MASQKARSEKIELQDIENKLRELLGRRSSSDIDKEFQGSQQFFYIAMGVLLVVFLAYLLGIRKGKKRSTIVEIRRG